MQYITNTKDFKIEEESVITLGKFDGLHRGHELLMHHLLSLGKEQNLKTIVFTFDIPPKNLLEEKKYRTLLSKEEKKKVFENENVDYLYECPFDKELMSMPAEDFVRWIKESLNIKYVVVGSDFCFGYKRAGDYKLLKKLESTYDYKTIVVNKIRDNDTDRDISSTYIREVLMESNIVKVNELLGYPYFVSGKVVNGNHIGRTIGIPTINLVVPEQKLLPGFGVYKSRVNIDGKYYKGITNVGMKPTIEGQNPVGVETHILDFNENVYDKPVVVEFLEFIRPEVKFPSIEKLKQQMEKDIAYVRIEAN